jgi:anti-sigma regulatory factor (Ser/Thr protein kinase)
MRSARRFPCEVESVAAARHFVRNALRDQPDGVVEAVELMTSELATNSVRHAHSGFELAIDDSREQIRVEVSDTGEGQPMLRSPAISERSGRGLRIVQALSDAWGSIPATNGKMVWFTLPTRAHATERESQSVISPDEPDGSRADARQPHTVSRRALREGLNDSPHGRSRAELRLPLWKGCLCGRMTRSSRSARRALSCRSARWAQRCRSARSDRSPRPSRSAPQARSARCSRREPAHRCCLQERRARFSASPSIAGEPPCWRARCWR